VERPAAWASTSVPQRGFRVLEHFSFQIKELNGTNTASGVIFRPPWRPTFNVSVSPYAF
jgi:hypothetical protein